MIKMKMVGISGAVGKQVFWLWQCHRCKTVSTQESGIGPYECNCDNDVLGRYDLVEMKIASKARRSRQDHWDLVLKKRQEWQDKHETDFLDLPTGKQDKLIAKWEKEATKKLAG